MKKILFSLLLISGAMTSLGAHAAFSSVSCGGLPGSGGCGSCFQQSSPIYTCNPHQSSCNKQMINSMDDIATNVSGGGKFMRQAYPGTIAMARVQNTTSWTVQSAVSQMFELTPAFFSPAPAVGQKGYQLAASGYYGHYLPVGTSVKWVQMKSSGWIRPDLAQAGTSRTSPAYKVTFTPRLYTDATNYIDHAQCVFFYVRFCGDGVRDTDRGEQCDDGNMASGDGCSNICEPEVPITPICTNLTVTPTGVVNGGSVTYTCTGTNVTSYSVIARRPDGSVFATSTGSAGSIIVPATPVGGYTISCYVNGQITTPASCQKTVQNTTVVEPICVNLSVTPTSVVNGGTVTYTCNANNASSYSVQFSRPDGTVFQTLTTSTGSVTIPATPTGAYTAKCFINGQTSTPESCQKTVTNTTVAEPICTNLTVTPTSVVNGGTVTYTCNANNASSYSVQFSRPDGTVFQTLTTSTGSVTIPATPTGAYTAKCFINGQTTTPESCQKNVQNTTVVEPICVNLSVTPTSVVNGGNVSYTCTGNNVTSWSIQFSRPDGTVFQTLTTPTGTVTIPATPTGAYTAKCFINGQTSTPEICQKTVTNTTVVTPTCDNLAVTVSGTTANYTCTGTNASSYRITHNGTQIGTNQTGSLNVGYGTHTFICYVNDSITSAACQKTVTINQNPPNPLIQVVKDDNDNHDDRQFLQDGSAAQFTIVVRNPGTEALENVTLNDPYAPECNRTSAQTQAMIVNVGNRDSRLDPGESFSYICTRTNVYPNTFPNNENRICVDGRGYISGLPVNSCDITRIEFGPVVCQNIQVTQNGNQTNVVCSPSGGYRLFVLNGTTVLNTYQNNNGQFSFDLAEGTYKVACLKDGEQSFQPSCQKMVTVSPKSNYCTMTSSTQFGGAPLRTKLDCRSNTYAQCHIRILKDGKPWGNVADCFADMVFEEKGVYDAICVIDGNEEQNCRTRVQVDIMTVIPTGPFLPVLIILAMGTAGYIVYRRRKTV